MSKKKKYLSQSIIVYASVEEVYVWGVYASGRCECMCSGAMGVFG